MFNSIYQKDLINTSDFDIFDIPTTIHNKKRNVYTGKPCQDCKYCYQHCILQGSIGYNKAG